jgi:putative SOS response-associated peptidase YedK
MCGRFAQTTSSEDLVRLFQLIMGVSASPRFNLAPTQPVLTVRASPNGRIPQAMRWGLVPPWAPDLKRGASMINARAETVFEKRTFSQPARQQRCIIPASGFYEWRETPAGKMPTLFRPADSSVFRFAGLWSAWAQDDGEVVYTTTILTTEANTVMRPFHHRMPVILSSEDSDRWLCSETQQPDQLLPLLRPAPPKAISLLPVSKRVNNVRHDDQRCWDPPSIGHE